MGKARRPPRERGEVRKPPGLRSLKPPEGGKVESTVPGLTVPEIAEKYGRHEKTIRWWMYMYDWPEPARKLGRRDFYDAGAVYRAVRGILGLPAEDGADPDELLDTRGAAEEAGISWGTLRAYIHRDQWPGPDDVRDGVRLWKRSTVRDKMASRRPSSRRVKREP
jgi:hypothetical protein